MYLRNAVWYMQWRELPEWMTAEDGREVAAQLAIDQLHAWVKEWCKFKGLEK
jgi:hypothetical protein